MKTDDVLRRNWLIPEKRSAYDVGALLGQRPSFLLKCRSQAWVVEASATDEDQQLGLMPPACGFPSREHVRAACGAVTH